MKETIIQFGEGGFLRSFADMFVHQMNEQGLYEGSVVVVQPIEKGLVSVLNQQNGTYHQFLRGIDQGELVESCTEVTSISRGINPYTEYAEYLSLADNPDMRIIISNTTEAGIEFLGTEHLHDEPPKSFPAKLAALLFRRFETGLPGFIILACELIDSNADLLKQYVMQYADLWKLPQEFVQWLERENHFCNTLVDRICTGYPSDEADELTKYLGAHDPLMNTAEIFHLWVIEGNFEEEFPLQRAGVNVVWTDDVTPYKKRKVRILNGGHTAMVLGARLYGLSTVKECLEDELVGDFLRRAMFEEIIPTLGNREEDIAFGKAVLERFANPFVKHRLLSIALNSVSKFRTRVLPTILEYYEEKKKFPPCLTLSLAALICFYHTDEANDVPEVMDYIRTAEIGEVLAKEEYWGRDLSFMKETIERMVSCIEQNGMASAYREEWGFA